MIFVEFRLQVKNTPKIKRSANFKFCRFKLCQFEPAWCFLEMQKMARRPPCVPCLEITSDIARESDSQTRDKMVCFDLHTTEPAWVFTAPGVSSSPSGPGLQQQRVSNSNFLSPFWPWRVSHCLAAELANPRVVSTITWQILKLKQKTCKLYKEEKFGFSQK